MKEVNTSSIENFIEHTIIYNISKEPKINHNKIITFSKIEFFFSLTHYKFNDIFFSMYDLVHFEQQVALSNF